MMVDVVENPRKRRKARRKPVTRSKRRVYRRKRRNPSLSLVSNAGRRRSYRRKSNPFKLGGFSVTDAAYTGAGVLMGAKLPPVMRRFGLPVPSGAIFDSLIAAAFGVFGAKYLSGVIGRRAANQMANGSIAYAFYNLLDVYVAPAVGLSGVNLYRPVQPVKMLGRYVRKPGVNAGRVIKVAPSNRSMRELPLSY